jgi:hypothetical protein
MIDVCRGDVEIDDPPSSSSFCGNAAKAARKAK